jgi:putative ABC transport system permease protein
MRNWQHFVRERLRLPELAPEREARIIRELASQLEDFYRSALARGATEAEADAHALAQVRDWQGLAAAVSLAERPNVRPRIERLTDAVDGAAASGGGRARVFADVLRDLRYAVRQLTDNPGFTAVAVLALAVGIGATTSIFTVINGVLLRPLPYPAPEELVRVHEIVPQYGRFSVAPATFLDWRQQNTVLERIAAWDGSTATLGTASGPERVSSAEVSWDVFQLLEVEPVLGRGFRAEEEHPGRNNVIVLSHGMWQRRFGGDRGVLGRIVALSGTPVAIVGVMPAGFHFPARDTEFWRPLALEPANATRGGHYLGVIARMKNGVTVQQANAELKTISERLALQYPQASAEESAEVIPLHDNVVGRVRPALLTLLAAVGVVILIACANVANLLLVRASVREKEIAIRIALGAGRVRLVRQMLVESLVLALAGGVLGLLLAYAAIDPIQTLSAGSVPRVQDVVIDRRVLGFALVVSVLTGVIFGLAPAWQASRGEIGDVLKEGGRSSVVSGGRRLRSALLIGEVALSIVLLVGATLLVRSFFRITSVDPGFRADEVLAFRIALHEPSYPEPHNQVAFYERLRDDLEALPEVSAAGMAQTLPLRGDYVLSFAIEGRPAADSGAGVSANYRSVTEGYFQALGIPLMHGRTFTAGDGADAPKVAIVDEAFVRRHFPTEDAIGRGIDIGNGTDGFYKIVGVVGDVHHEGLDANPEPTMYVPLAQDAFDTIWVVAKSGKDPSSLSAAVRQVVHDIDPGLPVYSVVPLSEVLSDSVAERRFSMLLLGLFAVSALFLAAVGLYGVVAYGVSQRTQELGVRMAMGARPADLLRMVIGGGLKLALAGVVIGLAGALALARIISSMLFGVTPFDPASYLATAVMLLAVATLACYLPARRATRVDPIVALRQP